MKWLGVIVLTVIGIVAAVFAIEYFTVMIGHLPSWIPGHTSKLHHGHLKYGHYRKRGAISAFIALLAFAGAGFLTYRNVKSADKGDDATTPAPSAGAGASAAPTSTGQLLATPPPAAAPGESDETPGS